MNKESSIRFIGIGVALVDYVFRRVDQEFPATRGEILSYIADNKADLIRAGGPMANTFTAISRLSNKRLKLFHCVGADHRGDLFQKETIPEIGLPQVHPTEPTGVWVGFSEDIGRLRFGLSYYGAALKVRVTKDELEEESNGVFITDVSSCKNEEINSQADMILKQLNRDGGIFVLSLGGAGPSSLDHERLSAVIGSLKYKPQIVFSNLEEFKYTTQMEDTERSIRSLFPNARLVVVTDREEGSLIRFEDQLIKVPALSVDDVKDEVGAGDAYMGTMLGQLFNYPYKSWSYELVENAAKTAAFAASQIVTGSSVRLTVEQSEAVLSYAKGKVPTD